MNTPTTLDLNFYTDIVQRRDAEYDGVFYYAVKTTGVYCKPSCASRPPKPENIFIFFTRDAATDAGFRACKRCKPHQDITMTPHAKLVLDTCRRIEADSSFASDLSRLAEAATVSAAQLLRVFKRLTGISPKQYAEMLRTNRFKALMQQGDSVTGAAFDAGFGSSSRLYEKSNTRLGMTPATYRRKGKGMTIVYAAAPSSLGTVLVGATERGICTVALGDSAALLEADLQREFSAATLLTKGDTTVELSQALEAIVAYLDGQRRSLELPTDIQATAFQRRVWDELRRIPYGSTATYSEIAGRIGHQRASRAVATACASNPVALLTPCHRVVRGDGSLAGYRWGKERKRKLLDMEKASSLTPVS